MRAKNLAIRKRRTAMKLGVATLTAILAGGWSFLAWGFFLAIFSLFIPLLQYDTPPVGLLGILALATAVWTFIVQWRIKTA